jgi:hypothetical protein
VKLFNFLEDISLNTLRSGMGAPLSNFRLEINLPTPTFIKREQPRINSPLPTEGLDVEAREITSHYDATLIYKNKRVIIENFSTADRSRYLRQFNCKKIIRGNYSFFLGEPGPYNPGDHLYFNIKNPFDHTYYDCLNKFFSDFEKINKTEVVIESHPKAIAEKDSQYFNNRLAFYNKTNELVKNCKFIICFGSVSLSYALLHKKPVCFLYNSKLKFRSSSFIKQIKLFHKLIGGKLIDINNYKKKELFFISNSIILNKYTQFIKNYISCRNDNKANHQIIEELIKKNQYLLWK